MNSIKEKKRFNLSLTVTNSCNLDCTYCYEKGKNKKRANIKQLKSIITEHLNSGEHDEVIIDFFGGEPFLAFKTIKIISEWIWSHQWRTPYLCFATTNGTLVHGDIKEWLKNNKHRFWASLSLDGKRESHNINRCNSFDQIDIDFFRHCWPDQPVKMTISKETAPMMTENIKYLHSLGLKVVGTNFAEGFDWNEPETKMIIYKQLEELATYYINHPQIKPVPLLDLKIELCEMPRQKQKWCGTGEYMCIYDINGDKFPCSFFTPLTFSYDELEVLKNIDFSEPNNFIDSECFDNCYLYPICSNCYGANLLLNKSISIRDKGLCELVKMRAVFSAAIQANRILKGELSLATDNTLKAISHIHTVYN